jgi:hypothetical protein
LVELETIREECIAVCSKVLSLQELKKAMKILSEESEI